MNKINWLDHATNLVVVILGITIAFYLEGWRDGRKAEKQEQQYLNSFLTDLENDRQNLDSLLIVNRSLEKAMKVLTGASIGRKYDPDSLIFHVFAIQYIPAYKPQKATYESLKASGSLEIIREFKLRTRLVELYEQFYRGNQEFDKSIANHTENYIQPYFMKNLEYVAAGKIKTDFLNQNEVRNMLFTQQKLLYLRSEFYETLDVELNEIIDLVQKRVTDKS